MLSGTKSRKRTSDVETTNSSHISSFNDLLLPKPIVDALRESGIEKPSPIQVQAIPVGRTGVDLIAQAKSGTGKTCVFAVLSLEHVDLSKNNPQVLILSPTREIALQIHNVTSILSKHLTNLVTHCFIGGMPQAVDEAKLAIGCHIVIGTPGRVLALIECGALETSNIRMFIIDEADRLLDDFFEKDMDAILDSLPEEKQILAFSATYTDNLIATLSSFMKSPKHVRVHGDDGEYSQDVSVSLKGVTQYIHKIPLHSNRNPKNELQRNFQEKTEKLLEIFSSLSFHQCIVFCNDQSRAETLVRNLSYKGYPAAFISGALPQAIRMETMDAIRQFRLRVLVSTDLTARGIDIDRINLIINLDVPADPRTYLHRVGRTGRFGTFGLAISILTQEEADILKNLCAQIGVTIHQLPDEIPPELYYFDLENEQDIKIKENLDKFREERERKETERESLISQGWTKVEKDTKSEHKPRNLIRKAKSEMSQETKCQKTQLDMNEPEEQWNSFYSWHHSNGHSGHPGTENQTVYAKMSPFQHFNTFFHSNPVSLCSIPLPFPIMRRNGNAVTQEIRWVLMPSGEFL